MTTNPDPSPLQQVAHYVCWVCDDPRLLDPGRLHRIVWYAERSLVLKNGGQLTGATFVKRPSGPVCPLLGPALSALERANRLAIRQYSHTRDEEQYFATMPPELDTLSADTISILDLCIWAVCWEHAWVPRQRAHEDVLAVARLGEELPAYTAYAGATAPIEDEDLTWAMRQSNHLPHQVDYTELNDVRARDARIGDAFSAIEWFVERRPEAGTLLPGLQKQLYYYKQKGLIATDLPDIGVVFEIEQGRGKVRGYHFTFPDVQGEDSLIPPFGRA